MSPLYQLILERIQREGPITFADYMRMALYEPDYGYYVTGAAKMGWEGDYYTSTDVSSFFARCLGRQLLQMWEMLDCPTPFVVREQGAGRGNLAASIQTWAAAEEPAFSEALDYASEDINAGQDGLSERSDAPYVLLSNELVDAFPVHIFELYQKELYEVYVAEQDGRFYELLAEPSSPEIAAYIDNYKIPWTTFEEGWRAEINLDAQRWVARAVTGEVTLEVSGVVTQRSVLDALEARYPMLSGTIRDQVTQVLTRLAQSGVVAGSARRFSAA